MITKEQAQSNIEFIRSALDAAANDGGLRLAVKYTIAKAIVYSMNVAEFLGQVENTKGGTK